MPSVIKTVIFTILVPGTVTVYLPYRLLGPGATVASPFGLLGALPIVLGAMVYLWCAWDFAMAGHGTPAPIDPPKILVATGPYRVVRNPMYMGVLLILLGESVAFASFPILYYALVVWLFFHLFVVLYEEPTLRQKFGSSYQEYCNTVSRWIPRPPRQDQSRSSTEQQVDSMAWILERIEVVARARCHVDRAPLCGLERHAGS